MPTASRRRRRAHAPRIRGARALLGALAILAHAPRAARADVTPFLLSSLRLETDGSVTLGWTCETNAFGNLVFTVEAATGRGQPFLPISPPIPQTEPFTFRDAGHAGDPLVFYNVAAPAAHTPLEEPGAFDAFDASAVDGLRTVGFAGAVFDGRHVYFVPYRDGPDVHGRVLRHDTTLGFDLPASWRAYDASLTGAGGATGYSGGAFDGRYVYFAPQGAPNHGRVLRLDTTGDFADAGSWALHDAGATDGLPSRGFQGAVFDGRHVYFVPHFNGLGFDGVVLRYDTRAEFASASSWEAWDAGATAGLACAGYSGGVFDGRYVYFAPTFDGAATHGRVLRYDTREPFRDAAGWTARDSGLTSGLATTGFKGALFDGRYVYFVPYTPPAPSCNVLRLDTRGDFHDPASWAAFNASPVDGLSTEGYHAAAFDGRHLLLVPYQASGSVFHGRVLAFDTTAAFDSLASWRARDAGTTDALSTAGYVGAAFDGRYVYFAPYRNASAGFHGNVLRFDARLPRQVPATIGGGSTF